MVKKYPKWISGHWYKYLAHSVFLWPLLIFHFCNFCVIGVSKTAPVAIWPELTCSLGHIQSHDQAVWPAAEQLTRSGHYHVPGSNNTMVQDRNLTVQCAWYRELRHCSGWPRCTFEVLCPILRQVAGLQRSSSTAWGGRWILVKTATLQNGHTQNGHNSFGYQNGHNQNGHTVLVKTATQGGSLPKRPHCIWSKRPQREDHYQNGHTAFGQNGHKGRITTKTATLHLVKTATKGGSLPKRPHCIWSKRPHRKDHYQNGHTAFGQNGHTGRGITGSLARHQSRTWVCLHACSRAHFSNDIFHRN